MIESRMLRSFSLMLGTRFLLGEGDQFFGGNDDGLLNP
jgi:hypothetical protein